MAYAGFMDGLDDGWHGPFSRAHGAGSQAIYAALKAGRAQAKVDDARETEPPAETSAKTSAT
jgi:hypothetical protein